MERGTAGPGAPQLFHTGRKRAGRKKGKLEYLALPAAVRGEEEQLAGLVHSCRVGPELFLKKTTEVTGRKTQPIVNVSKRTL